MSKWSHDEAIAAFEAAGGRDRFSGYTNVGRAILDLCERAEKAEQRCAALEAACIEVRRWFDPKDTYGNFNTSRHMVAAINAALSGDTSALADMLERAAYLAHQDSSAFGNEDASAYVNAATAIAKRVMEGK